MKSLAFCILLVGINLGASALLPNLAWGQNAPAQPAGAFDATPIGKVLTATGTVHIEHAAAIVVQANFLRAIRRRSEMPSIAET